MTHGLWDIVEKGSEQRWRRQVVMVWN